MVKLYGLLDGPGYGYTSRPRSAGIPTHDHHTRILKYESVYNLILQMRKS